MYNFLDRESFQDLRCLEISCQSYCYAIIISFSMYKVCQILHQAGSEMSAVETLEGDSETGNPPVKESAWRKISWQLVTECSGSHRMLSDRFHLSQECRAEVQKQKVGPTYSLYIQQILPVSCFVKLHLKPMLINMESIVEYHDYLKEHACKLITPTSVQ